MRSQQGWTVGRVGASLKVLPNLRALFSMTAEAGLIG